MVTDKVVNAQVEHVVLDRQVLQDNFDWEGRFVVDKHDLGSEVRTDILNNDFVRTLTVDAN